jgi:uncharacterized protein YbjT (DUF2867 family)
MKIVVIGGTGLVGSKLVARLRRDGHEPVPASPTTGADTLTGDGLAPALDGADAVVDVSDSPSFEDDSAMRFFETSTRNLLDAASVAGVRHVLVLSVVGTDRLAEGGYFRAKCTQERLIETSPVPHTIVRSTQLFEKLDTVVDAATDFDSVRVPPVRIQPVAADDVAGALAVLAIGRPVEGIVEIAGPEVLRLDELVQRSLERRGERALLIIDPDAPFFGAELAERTLLPARGALVGRTRLADWSTSTGTRRAS